MWRVNRRADATAPAGRAPHPAGPDLDEALTAALRGDPDAFRVLYRDTQPRVLRYLHALVGGDAEDVASETWLQVARDLAGFTGDADDKVFTCHVSESPPAIDRRWSAR